MASRTASDSLPPRGTTGAGGLRPALFFCRCGPNIGEVVRLAELARPDSWPGAVRVEELPVPCSPEGRALLLAALRESRADRVVLAGCSPREHEATFRAVLAEAGLDPFLFQMVNLREQREWAGGSADLATARARSLVRGALRRVARHVPVPVTEVDASPDAVVVGGGPAGLSAALTLAQKGRRVVLVERDHVLGGLAATLDEVFPSLECASCFLDPVLSDVLHHPRIEVLTGAEVTEVLGSNGNFAVRLRLRPRYVDAAACLGSGCCAQACPVEVPEERSGGLGRRKAVHFPYPGCLPNVAVVDPDRCLHLQGKPCDACVGACAFGAIRLDARPEEREVRCGAVVLATGSRPAGAPGRPDVVTTYQLERMLHPNGPTGGVVRRAAGGAPTAVLLAPTPEAADADAALWPQELAKLALQLREKLPGVRVSVAGGLDRAAATTRLAADLAGAGVELLGGTLAPEAVAPRPRGLSAKVAGRDVEADLVVLHGASRPAEGAAELAARLRVRVRPDGFLEDQGNPFEPAATRVPGVLVAGAAGGPRTLAAAVRDGAAAAGRVLSALVPGERLVLEPLAARVDAERCGACGVCVSTCAFGAVSLSADGGRSRVEPAHCRGCGGCVAACPSGAIAAPHFTRLQIEEEIAGLLEE